MATLEYYKKALLFKTQNMSSVPMSDVIKQTSKYYNAHCNVDNANVEESALMFYLLNQAFGNLFNKFDKKEELPADADALCKAYLESASLSSARLFYYILLIITREARHLHSSSTFYYKIEKEFGSDYATFLKNTSGKGSDGAVKQLLNSGGGGGVLKNVTFGQYTTAVTKVFNEGHFSGGYGGKPWGNIANTLRKVAFGETSLEIMNDTAWTLAHNNGPMFNKGMLYKGYTQAIYKILDVQRSGQIPELINEGFVSYVIPQSVKDAFALAKPYLEIAGYVDWYKVEALGSLHKYPNEKKAQKAKGISPSLNEAIKAGTKLWITPTDYITAVERKAVA